MNLKKMKKEDLELLSNKDIAFMIMSESKRKYNTADLFKKIMKLLELPDSTFEEKIADFYTALSTDKRFILLENGKWDLRNNHTSDKVVKISAEFDEDEDEDDEDEEIDELEEEKQQVEIEEDNYDDTDDSSYDDASEELKDLVVIDNDELELEE